MGDSLKWCAERDEELQEQVKVKEPAVKHRAQPLPKYHKIRPDFEHTLPSGLILSVVQGELAFYENDDNQRCLMTLTAEDVAVLQSAHVLTAIPSPGERLYTGLPFHVGGPWSRLTDDMKLTWEEHAANLGVKLEER